MTTRRDILTKAYPDHIKLIEKNRLAYEDKQHGVRNWLAKEVEEPEEHIPGTLLCMAFLWAHTPEGHDFWASLSDGGIN